MFYYANEFGIVLFASEGPHLDKDTTALVRQPQWDGSGPWVIAYTDENGDRQHVGGFRNPWAARRLAVEMGVWR